MIFPEIFLTGVVPDDRSKLALLADALCAWGICAFGNEPPPKFGEVMVEIGDRLNFTPTGENCLKLSKEWRDAGKPLDFFEQRENKSHEST